MNILLISQLYPAYPGQPADQVNDALHRLVRRWLPRENVLVVRPYIIPDFRRENRAISRRSFLLDEVAVLCHPFFKIPKTSRFFFMGLYREITKTGFTPDVVLAHLGYSLRFGYRLSRFFGVPLISAVHFGDLQSGEKMLKPKRLRRIYHHSAGIACRSPAIFRRFAERYPALEGRCFLAYSGIESELIQEESFALRKLQQWKGKAKNGAAGIIDILSVCSLVPLKNIDVNLRALAGLDQAIDWRYTVIGDGEQRPHLEQLASSLGIADRVRFLGKKTRQEVLAQMKEAHIFIMVSAPETFGLVYLEALASGCLVIGAEGYGIDGVIENEKNGFLCPPRDEAGLCAALDRIVRQMPQSELARVLANAHETIKDHTEEKAAADYLRHIYRVLGA